MANEASDQFIWYRPVAFISNGEHEFEFQDNGPLFDSEEAAQKFIEKCAQTTTGVRYELTTEVGFMNTWSKPEDPNA